MEEKNIENEQLEQKDIPKNNVKLTVLLIVISILLIVGCICLGFYLGKSSNYEEENKNQTEEKEEVNNTEDKKEENLTIIDKNEAPNPTIVKVEKNKVVISNKKPDYYEEEDLPYYKDGYVGYYSDDVIGLNNTTSGIMFIDEPKYEFVPLYKCKNPEYGKCGYAETMGVTGEYNLEEGLKIAQEGLVYLDDRYVFVYDSNYYLEEPYTSYFSKEVPLIVYDTETNKELGKYSGIYYSYGDSSDALVAVDLEGDYGVIGIKDGKISNIVEFKYDYIGKLYEQDNFMLVDNGQYYVYYVNTKTKVGPFNNQIASYSDKYIVTNEGRYLKNNENNYRVYSSSGEKILVEDGYKYLEIAGKYIIAVNAGGEINVIDQNGKAILNEWIKDVYGDYHIRCCMSIMAFRYELLGSTMELYITKNGKNEDEIDVYKYTIDLINRSYEVELYESF